MRRREYIIATSGAALGTAVAGCLGGGGSTGTLATQVTDQPGDIDDFESCVVKPSADDGATDTEGTGMDYDVDDAEADLVELQDGETELVAEQELETGEYDYLKLVSGVEATLSDGGDAAVTTPGEAPLKFDRSFDIRGDTRTAFTADFTPVERGQAGGYILQPVADGTEVSYEE
jgi:hypothetical protein